MIANQVAGLLAAATPPAPVGDYESIQTVTLSSSQTTVSLTSIPSTYKHLQLRIMARGTSAAVQVGAYLQLNSDTGANYTNHFLDGNGTSPSAGAYLSETRFIFGNLASGTATSGIFGTSITDILDYTNTNKYKVGRTIGGNDRNGSGYIAMYSNMWMNTAAITRIDITPTAGSWAQYSSFALYGVK